MSEVAKRTYTPHCSLVYIEGKARVAARVHIHTDAAAQGPEIDRSEAGKISEEIIHGRPFAPQLLFDVSSTL